MIAYIEFALLHACDIACPASSVLQDTAAHHVSGLLCGKYPGTRIIRLLGQPLGTGNRSVAASLAKP